MKVSKSFNELANKTAELTSSVIRRAKKMIHRGEEEVGFADVYLGELSTDKIDVPIPDGHGGKSLQGLYTATWKEGLLGLALSGGGIRSATFNLGVIQALCQLGLLRRISYLSTVSGGGYIGAWLTALIHREGFAYRQKNPQSPVDHEAFFDELEKKLAPTGSEECPQITHLRNYSNYLTPKIGLMSADTWSAIAIYLRNLLLNLSLLVGTLVGLFLVVWLFTDSVAGVARNAEAIWDWTLLAGIGFCAMSAIAIGYNMASVADKDPDEPNGVSDSGVFALVILPALLGSIAAVVWVPYIAAGNATLSDSIFPNWFLDLDTLVGQNWPKAVDPYVFIAVLGTLANTAIWLMAWLAALLTGWHQLAHSGKMWALIVISGALTAGLLSLILVLLGTWLIDTPLYVRVVVVPPAIFVWLFLVAALHTGVVGSYMGTHYREWLSRASAWLLISATSWILIFGVVVFGPYAMSSLDTINLELIASGWLGTTIGGLVASRLKEGQKAGLARRVLLSVTPYVFVVGLLLVVSHIASSLIINSPSVCAEHHDGTTIEQVQVDGNAVAINVTLSRDDDIGGDGACVTHWLEYAGHFDVDGFRFERSPLVPIGLLILFVFVVSWRFNINEFSLRNMYANRLVRCYLGASAHKRHPQPFTGFSIFDDLWLGVPTGSAEELQNQFARNAGTPYDTGTAEPFLKDNHLGPYHLINTAVNISKTEKLSWQERKAAPYLLSPLYSGFEISLTDKSGSGGAYRRTDANQISIGDAIATSGAAANPSMGYRSRPGLSLLLAIFNIRLGRWVGNPENERTHKHSSPPFALWYLVKEALNITSDKDHYLQLSDGGHFDNLGLYSLVKRRCRYIICCDAGADGNFEFEDLGNAIRKCRIDLGVEIDIDVSRLRANAEQGAGNTPCTVGRINYPEENRSGYLVYIKPCKTGDMPFDVANYALSHPDFPHQTTGDQFFSESQFESYRELGRHQTQLAFGDQRSDALLSRFKRAQEGWVPRSSLTLAGFTKHAAVLDALYERLRTDSDLSILHDQIYPEWREIFDATPMHKDQVLQVPTGSPGVIKSCFYFCNAILQLMENVFTDLDLANTHRHVDNRGWINLFMHWSWSGMFRLTYTLTVATYGARFQTFCDEVIGLTIGQVTTRRLTLDELAAHDTFHDADYVSSAERMDGADLCFNFLEWQQISRIVEFQPDQPEALRAGAGNFEIYQIQLPIPGVSRDTAGRSARFSVGYAIVLNSERTEGVDQLVMFRIHNHMRSIGIGRSALDYMITERQVTACAPASILSGNLRTARESNSHLLSEREPIAESPGQEFKIEQAAKSFLSFFDDVRHEVIAREREQDRRKQANAEDHEQDA